MYTVRLLRHCVNTFLGTVAVHRCIYRTHWAMILAGGSIHTLRNMPEVRNSMRRVFRCPMYTAKLLALRERISWHSGCASAVHRRIHRTFCTDVLSTL